MQNRHTCELPDGTRLFYSYRKLIGFDSPAVWRETDSRPVFSDEFHSVTTSRHRNDYCREYQGVILPEYRFRELSQVLNTAKADWLERHNQCLELRVRELEAQLELVLDQAG